MADGTNVGGWNRNSQTRPAKPRPTARRGIFAGLCVVVLATGFCWLILRRQSERLDSDSDDSSMHGLIAEKKPEIAPKGDSQPSTSMRIRDSADSKKPKEEKKVEIPTYRDARGILRYEGGARVPGQRPTAKPIDLNAHRPKIFKHSAEEHISWMLEMKIGEPIIGDMHYGEQFVKSFKESLKEPIKILDTDDDATRDLKLAVMETKEELRRRMQNGEDVAAIMNESMDEYRRLGRYKHDLQVQLLEIQNDTGTYSDQDVQDFTEAANEMLKKEGLPPLTMPLMVMRGLRKGR